MIFPLSIGHPSSPLPALVTEYRPTIVRTRCLPVLPPPDTDLKTMGDWVVRDRSLGPIQDPAQRKWQERVVSDLLGGLERAKEREDYAALGDALSRLPRQASRQSLTSESDHRVRSAFARDGLLYAIWRGDRTDISEWVRFSTQTNGAFDPDLMLAEALIDRDHRGAPRSDRERQEALDNQWLGLCPASIPLSVRSTSFLRSLWAARNFGAAHRPKLALRLLERAERMDPFQAETASVGLALNLPERETIVRIRKARSALRYTTPRGRRWLRSEILERIRETGLWKEYVFLPE